MPRRHPPTLVCAYCGDAFLQWKATQQFCSVKCANTARNKAGGQSLDAWTTEWTEPSLQTEQRFWAKVVKTAGCWSWTAAQNGVGYGKFNFGPLQVYAHRVAYVWAHGPIPDELELDHLCRNRACVNPAHLEAVTRQINIRRSPLVGHHPRPEVCPQGHTRDGVLATGERYCKICSRANRARYLAAHREEEYAKNRAYWKARPSRAAQGRARQGLC